MHCGDFEYLNRQKEYMLTLVDMMTHIVDTDFKFDDCHMSFVDWSSNGQDGEIEGVKSVACIALDCLGKMLKILGENTAAGKMQRISQPPAKGKG